MRCLSLHVQLEEGAHGGLAGRRAVREFDDEGLAGGHLPAVELCDGLLRHVLAGVGDKGTAPRLGIVVAQHVQLQNLAYWGEEGPQVLLSSLQPSC